MYVKLICAFVFAFAKTGFLMMQLILNQVDKSNERTNGPVNAHLISWPSKAQNIQNLENIW